MWQFFCEVSKYSGIAGGYDIDVIDDGRVLPLDPIEREIVGALKVEMVMQWAEDELPAIHQILRRVLNGEVDFVPPIQKRFPAVAEKYKDHIADLEQCSILKTAYRLSHDRLHRFISGYFSIPKGISGFGRAILNGCAVSLLCLHDLSRLQRPPRATAGRRRT
jgi:hypothetical protein